jgi:hypothetical protein
MPLYNPPASLPLVGGTITGQFSRTAFNWWSLDSFAGTDDQKMTSALAQVVSAAAGTIELEARAHSFANQWSSAYVSSSVTSAMRIIGQGVAYNGMWGNPSAATTCDMQYSGAGAARMDFQHLGSIEITGIMFEDTVASTVPFLQTTNATPNIHDNVFAGNASVSGVTCYQDAIILGGTGTTIGAGDTAPYQGYQGSIARNFFHRIRCGVSCQTYANAPHIGANTWSITCGSNSSSIGAITINGGNPNYSVGGTTAFNLIESGHYPYAIWADWTTGWQFNSDSFFDPTTATTLAYIKFNSNNAKTNTVIVGYGTIGGSTPAVVFVSQAARLNTIITGQATNTTSGKGTLFANFPVIGDFGLTTNGEYNGVPHISLGDSAKESGNIPTVQTATSNPNTLGTVSATSGSIFIQRANSPTGQAAFFLKSGSGTSQWYIPGTMLPITTQTISYTILVDDGIVIMNGASLTATLPAPAAGLAGKGWTVINKASTALTVAAPSGTINGASSVSVAQWQAARVTTDGTNFYASVA